MAHFDRGNTVHFSGSFVDAANAPYSPSAAVLLINYPIEDDDRAEASVPLDLVGAAWSADWDSSVSVAGRVYYSVKVTNPEPFIAEDGYFELRANLANLQT